MTDDQQPLSIGLSYRERTPGNKASRWMLWTAVAVLYAVGVLILCWAGSQE